MRTTQEIFVLYQSNPESSTPYNNDYIAIYLQSHKSKKNEDLLSRNTSISNVLKIFLYISSFLLFFTDKHWKQIFKKIIAVIINRIIKNFFFALKSFNNENSSLQLLIIIPRNNSDNKG